MFIWFGRACCGEIDSHDLYAATDGEREGKNFQILPDNAGQFWCYGEDIHANDKVKGKILLLALLSTCWKAEDAPTCISLVAGADFIAVADVARPNKAWLTLTEVITTVRYAHCRDFKICNLYAVADCSNTGFFEISNNLGIRNCNRDFQKIS